MGVIKSPRIKSGVVWGEWSEPRAELTEKGRAMTQGVVDFVDD